MASLIKSKQVELVDVAAPISTVNAGDSASDGTSKALVRRDHQHAVATGAASGLDTSTLSSEGSSTNLARADHGHAISNAGTQTAVAAGNTDDAGTSAGFAKKDHRHATSTGAATGLDASSTNAEGAGTNLARASHTHALDTTNGTISTVNAGDTSDPGSATGLARRDHQHAVATAAAGSWAMGDSAAEGTSTSLARADHTHAVGTPGAPENIKKQTASAGTSANPARADHLHQIDTAIVTDVGTANAEGTSTSLARADHVHRLSTAAQQAVLETKRFAFGMQAVDFSASGGSATGNAITKKIFDLSISKKTGGSSVVSAVVTTAPENKTEVRDSATHDPIHGPYTDVYGRVTATVTGLAATYTWDGTTTVLSGDTSELAVGNFIKLNSDGQCFEVTGINTDVSVTISNPGGLTIPTGATTSSKVALTLTYYELNGSNVEIGYTFAAPQNIDFLFHEGLDLYRAPFDALSTGTAFAEALPAAHTHTLSQVTDVTATATEVNQALDGISANVTDTNLNTLTDGSSDATTLHNHAGAYSALGHNHDATYIAKSLLTTKGDIIAASASATPTRVGVGTDGQFLKADSGAASGVSWASPASSDVENQESLTTEAISGTDTALADQLTNTPKNNASVSLFLNGVQQEQGVGKDYTISGKVITWLASSGTAVDMETTDSLVACYVQ